MSLSHTLPYFRKEFVSTVGCVLGFWPPARQRPVPGSCRGNPPSRPKIQARMCRSKERGASRPHNGNRKPETGKRRDFLPANGREWTRIKTDWVTVLFASSFAGICLHSRLNHDAAVAAEVWALTEQRPPVCFFLIRGDLPSFAGLCFYGSARQRPVPGSCRGNPPSRPKIQARMCRSKERGASRPHNGNRKPETGKRRDFLPANGREWTRIKTDWVTVLFASSFAGICLHSRLNHDAAVAAEVWALTEQRPPVCFFLIRGDLPSFAGLCFYGSARQRPGPIAAKSSENPKPRNPGAFASHDRIARLRLISISPEITTT